MKELIGLFIQKGLPLLSLQEIEGDIDEWLRTPNEFQGIILPHLINQKLLKYEQEY